MESQTSPLDSFKFFYEDVAPHTNLILLKTKTERRADAINKFNKAFLTKAIQWTSFCTKQVTSYWLTFLSDFTGINEKSKLTFISRSMSFSTKKKNPVRKVRAINLSQLERIRSERLNHG